MMANFSLATNEEMLGGENVSLDDFDLWILAAKLLGEGGVEFDGNKAMGSGSEEFGDCAFSGANLEHRGGRDITKGFDDGQRGRGVDEEVLSELWFGGHRSRCGESRGCSD